MLRAYITNDAWVDILRLPRTGILVEIECPICKNNITLLAEKIWAQYRKVICKCRNCDAEIGHIFFEEEQS